MGELDRNFDSVVGKILNSSLLSGNFGQLDYHMVKEMSQKVSIQRLLLERFHSCVH